MEYQFVCCEEERMGVVALGLSCIYICIHARTHTHTHTHTQTHTYVCIYVCCIILKMNYVPPNSRLSRCESTVLNHFAIKAFGQFLYVILKIISEIILKRNSKVFPDTHRHPLLGNFTWQPHIHRDACYLSTRTRWDACYLTFTSRWHTTPASSLSPEMMRRHAVSQAGSDTNLDNFCH